MTYIQVYNSNKIVVRITLNDFTNLVKVMRKN